MDPTLTICIAVYGAVMTLLTFILAFKTLSRNTSRDERELGISEGRLQNDITYIKTTLDAVRLDTTKIFDTLGTFKVLFTKYSGYIREIFTRLDEIDHKGIPTIEQ